MVQLRAYASRHSQCQAAARLIACVRVCFIALFVGCHDDPSSPPSSPKTSVSKLRVTVSTSGADVDTDGYQLMLRTGQTWMPTGQRRSLSLSLRLEIDGLPAGLSRHGETAQLTFASNDEYTPFLLYFLEAGVRLAHVSSDGLNDPHLHL